MNEIEEQITKKRVPALVALVAKLESQAFAAELEAAALRGQAACARAELQRLLGEPAPAQTAPLPPPPLSPPPAGQPLQDELSTCPDPDLHLPRAPVLSDLARAAAPRVNPKDDPLAEAGRRGYAVGQEETLARVAELLHLEEAEGSAEEVWATIEDRLHALQHPGKTQEGIADHVVPPAPDIEPAPEARPARQASDRHLLQGRGGVVCGRSPEKTRGLRTSNPAEVTCPDCLDGLDGAGRRIHAEPAPAAAKRTRRGRG